MLARGHRVVPRRPLEFGRGVVRPLFRPRFLEIGFREDHVFDVIFHFLTRLLGEGGAEVGQHFGRDAAASGEVLLAPGALNVDQALLEGRLSAAVISLSTVAFRKGAAEEVEKKMQWNMRPTGTRRRPSPGSSRRTRARLRRREK